MYRGSSIELNALGGSWRCRKCQKNRLLHVWVSTRDLWSRQSVGNAKNRLLLVLGRDMKFLITTEFFLVLCRDMVSDVKPSKLSQHGFLCCDRGSSSLS